MICIAVTSKARAMPRMKATHRMSSREVAPASTASNKVAAATASMIWQKSSTMRRS